MTHEELKSRLPHRDAMLLVGEVTTKDGDENTAVGKTYIRGDEWFTGTFPRQSHRPRSYSLRDHGSVRLCFDFMQ